MTEGNPRYSYGSRSPSSRRSRGGIGVPYGALGVAALTGGIGALIGLIVPMHLIEAASWQLYLDQFIHAARPPLGSTARLAAMLMAAGLLGGLGWLIAKLLRVRADSRLLDRLIARVRGFDGADEAGAPTLRAADRHPDAPARRPFSAARDIPVAPPEMAEDAPMWVDRDWSADVAEPDELLLDASFDSELADADAVADVEVAPAEPVASAEPATSFDPVALAEPEAPAPLLAEDIGPLTVEDPASPLSIAPETPLEIATAPAAAPAAAPAPEPLDLSVARLDELIARLEAGLTRRSTLVAQAAGAAEAAGAADATAGQPARDGFGDDTGPVLARGLTPDDPAFPQDPALAAALATLRRMNGNSH